MKTLVLISGILLLFVCFQCPERSIRTTQAIQKDGSTNQPLTVGAQQLNDYISDIRGKRVGLVVNHTSTLGHTHLADTLKSLGISVTTIFAPEHGFRGMADAGEHIKDGLDVKLGIPIVSLYGNNKKPSKEQLRDIDIMVFDIQDVGARFYTYISTLHYTMEACAENNKSLIILDRPNPNGNFIDGPVLKSGFQSFVGMHPIPIAHGLTVGELAQMINGEGWLDGHRKCNLRVIPVKNWSHSDAYSLPLKPSPNLPDDQSIKLYPSLCLFEGTVISVGRGTLTPFQLIGHPDLKNMPHQFTPVSIEGMSKNPPHENKICYGLDLRQVPVNSDKLNLSYLITMYNAFPNKEKFFNSFFEKLAGNAELKQQVQAGLSEEQIRSSWNEEIEKYKETRKKYLLYP